jgi:3,4-dihydroxy 2-butanone 4-phosphate synthase/GTP cyclohydrolase II
MHPDLVRRTTTARIPTAEGTFQLSHYVDARDGKEHLALVMGQVQDQQRVLVRVHSECFTGDVLGSQRCDCGEQLHHAMQVIAQEGQGIVIYLRQEGRGIGLEQKLKAYNLQDLGYDTVDANLMLGHQADEREYSAAAAILLDLDIASIRLMTNNPSKIDHLQNLGIQIDERLPLASTVTQDNAAYLATKVERMRHLLTLPQSVNGHNHTPTEIGSDNGLDRTPTVEPKTESEIDKQLANLHDLAQHHHAQHGRPYITLSYAQTLDGTIGATSGEQLHISSPESMIVTHRLRAQHEAILVGIGTILADDPQLTVRLVEGPNPQPIIVDSHLRIPAEARIWSHPTTPWIATLDIETPTALALRKRGAQLIQLPASGQHVDLGALFAYLGDVGIHSVMVEGGAAIIASLLRQQLAHHAVVTLAPRYQPGVRLNPPAQSAMAAIQAPRYTQVGSDMLIWGQLASQAVSRNGHSPEALPTTISTYALPSSPAL